MRRCGWLIILLSMLIAARSACVAQRTMPETGVGFIHCETTGETVSVFITISGTVIPYYSTPHVWLYHKNKSESDWTSTEMKSLQNEVFRAELPLSEFDAGVQMFLVIHYKGALVTEMPADYDCAEFPCDVGLKSLRAKSGMPNEAETDYGIEYFHDGKLGLYLDTQPDYEMRILFFNPDTSGLFMSNSSGVSGGYHSDWLGQGLCDDATAQYDLKQWSLNFGAESIWGVKSMETVPMSYRCEAGTNRRHFEFDPNEFSSPLIKGRMSFSFVDRKSKRGDSVGLGDIHVFLRYHECSKGPNDEFLCETVYH